MSRRFEADHREARMGLVFSKDSKTMLIVSVIGLGTVLYGAKTSTSMQEPLHSTPNDPMKATGK